MMGLSDRVALAAGTIALFSMAVQVLVAAWGAAKTRRWLLAASYAICWVLLALAAGTLAEMAIHA